METLPIEHQTITMIVDNVDQAKREVQQAFDLLIQARKRLGAALGGNGHYYDRLFNHQISDFSLDREAKDSLVHITKNAWRYILEQTQLNAYMTERRQKELQSQIEKDELPPLTVENIVGTLQGLAGKIDGLLMESVKEVFDWLRPQGEYGNGKLKTNHKFKVGPKVIVYGVERNYSGGWRFNSYRQADFRALGNVFSLMDGKGVLKYPDDFVSRFNNGMAKAEAGEKFDTEYFRIKCYGNGNAHIEFTRLDLVDTLNQLGSNGDLPGKE